MFWTTVALFAGAAVLAAAPILATDQRPWGPWGESLSRHFANESIGYAKGDTVAVQNPARWRRWMPWSDVPALVTYVDPDSDTRVKVLYLTDVPRPAEGWVAVGAIAGHWVPGLHPEWVQFYGRCFALAVAALVIFVIDDLILGGGE